MIDSRTLSLGKRSSSGVLYGGKEIVRGDGNVPRGRQTKAEKPGEAGAVTIPETQEVRLAVDYSKPYK